MLDGAFVSYDEMCAMYRDRGQQLTAAQTLDHWHDDLRPVAEELVTPSFVPGELVAAAELVDVSAAGASSSALRSEDPPVTSEKPLPSLLSAAGVRSPAVLVLESLTPCRVAPLMPLRRKRLRLGALESSVCG